MKRILTLLILALILTLPALAAEGTDTGQTIPIITPAAHAILFPSEVREVQAGDFRRIEKVYLLEPGADPAAVFTGAPTTIQEPPAETPAGAMLHYGLPALIIAALLVVAGVGVYQLIKHRRSRRYLT